MHSSHLTVDVFDVNVQVGMTDAVGSDDEFPFPCWVFFLCVCIVDNWYPSSWNDASDLLHALCSDGG